MFFCCVFFFRGFHPRLETLNCYAVPEERFASVILLLRVLCELARDVTLRSLRSLRLNNNAAETTANQRVGGIVLRKRYFLKPARRPRQTPSRGRFRLRHFVIHTTNVSYSLLLPTAPISPFIKPFNDFLMTILFGKIQERFSFFVFCVDVGAAFYKPLSQFQISEQNCKM